MFGELPIDMKREDLPYGLQFAGLNNGSTDPVYGMHHPGQGIPLNFTLGVSMKGLATWASYFGFPKPSKDHELLKKPKRRGY